jgi:glyoxylase-like metal-dependent hydrolase (beta-lactamase superfamily II)
MMKLLLPLACLSSLALAQSTAMKLLAHVGRSDLYEWSDTANVYVLRQGDHAILFDLGDGSVLRQLPGIGVKHLDFILFTSHHRELVQGYPLLAPWQPKVAVPALERRFFEDPYAWRKVKPSLSDKYTVHGASFLRPSVHPIKVDLAFDKMDDFRWRDHRIRCIQTRGNSPGAMTYLLESASGFIAISGDVMLNGARMYNWFDTEWDYGFASGLYALVDSAALLEQYNPFLLLPSHGPVVRNPKAQLAQYQTKLRQIEPLYLRGYSVFRFAPADQDRVSKPTAVPHIWQVSPHIYKFKGPDYLVNFNLITSDDGHGLLIDCGLFERAFLDKAIARMQETFGLKQIDACLITHMHGDHMLDAEHIRQRWGTQVWALDRMVDKMEHPEWFDYAALIESYPTGVPSVPVDRVFHPGEKLDWRGYRFTVDWMPGQTEFALALRGIIDGRTAVFTGDNIFGDPADPGQNGHEAVVARNSSIFEEGYIYGAEYLKRIRPDIILGGHSYVMNNSSAMIERYRSWAYRMRDALRGLSSQEDYRYWYDPYWVRAEPYRFQLHGGSREVLLTVRNFHPRPQSHVIKIDTPPGITAEPNVLRGSVAAESRQAFPVKFHADVSARSGAQIVAFDVMLDGQRYGEWFDAVVEVAR